MTHKFKIKKKKNKNLFFFLSSQEFLTYEMFNMRSK